MEFCEHCHLPFEAVTIVTSLSSDEANRTYVCRCAEKSGGVLGLPDAEEEEEVLACIVCGEVESSEVYLSPEVDYRMSVLEPLMPTFTTMLIDSTAETTEAYTEYELSLDRRLSKVVYDAIEVAEVSYIEVAYACPLLYVPKGIEGLTSARCRVRTGAPGTLKAPISSRVYAPGMSYKKSIEWEMSSGSPEPEDAMMELLDAYRVRVHCKVVDLGDWHLSVKRYLPDDSYNCEFEWQGAAPAPSSRQVAEMLSVIHSDYAMASEMASYIDRHFLLRLRTNAIPTVDLMKPPMSSHIYRVKVDGEQTWVIDAGVAWYHCRPGKTLPTVGYVMKGYAADYYDCPAAMRCEELIDGTLVFIDALSYRVGSSVHVLPITRPVSADYHALVHLNFTSTLVKRDFYDSFEGALRESKRGRLHCDGVIAMDPDRSLTYRIKDPLTVDLVVTREGQLTHRSARKDATEGETIAWPAEASMKPGEIYECEVMRRAGKVVVNPTRARPDKEVANSADVVADIVAMLRSSSSVDYVLMRRITAFSFEVREYVYSAAISAALGKLVIDVGSGRMQSFSFFKDKRMSFLLCDPEFKLHPSEQKHAWLDITPMDAESRLNIVAKMNSGQLKRAFYRGTLASLLNSDAIVKYIISKRIPLAYSYSLSHLPVEFIELSRRGAKQIGVGYMYDKVNSDGVLVRKPGVLMKISEADSTRADVEWYGTETYSEYAITTSDFPACRVVPVSSELLSYATLAHDVKDVCQHIYIVNSQ